MGQARQSKEAHQSDQSSATQRFDERHGAEQIEQRNYTVNRERIGLAANLDWRSDRSQFYWRNLYSEFSDQEYRMRNEFKFDDGDAVSGDSSSGQWQDAVIEKSMTSNGAPDGSSSTAKCPISTLMVSAKTLPPRSTAARECSTALS